jgi:hypothetical protein
MSTTLTRGRSKARTSSNTTISKGSNAQVFAAALMDFEMKIYNIGSTPLYDLVTTYGKVVCQNTLDTAYQSFNEIKQSLEVGDAGFSYSNEFDQFNLALRMPDNGIVFAGLLHDQNGSPRVDESLALCRVKTNRDFQLNGETIIRKGQEFIKALPESYLGKIRTAA